MVASAQTLPTDAQTTCTVSSTMFNSFFHSGTAAVDGVVDPANSVTFPNVPNCSFYQWAQQMFLWLTSPAPPSYGGGGGRIFASPQFFTVSPADSGGKRTLIPNSSFRLGPLGPILNLNLRAAQVGVHGLPVVMSKSGQMFEVQPGPVSKKGNPIVLNRAGQQVEVSKAALQNGKVVLLNTAGKAIAAPKLSVPKQIPLEQMQRLRPQQQILTEALPMHPQMQPTAAHVLALQKLQPAPVNPNLIAQRFTINGKNIFLNVNGGVIETEEGQADDGVLLAQNGSLIYYVTMVNDVMAYFLTGVKDGGITPTPTQFPINASDLAKITTFASAHSKTFPDPNALAIEVKSAWIDATAVADPSQYITTQAVIALFKPNPDPMHPNEWIPNGQTTTKLALIGMHVVGSANGHPEMIWATFEHFGNAPNAAYTYNATSGPNPHTVPLNTSGTWLFCANGAAPPFNQMHAQFVTPNIEGISGPPTPTNVIRFKPFGGAANASPNPADATVAASNTEIISIDNSVASDFGALSGGPDIRTNYFMTGATWTINGFGFISNFGNPGNPGIINGHGVGTSQLSNTTMETFQQMDTNFNMFSNNCFSCHQTNQLNVSHVACQPFVSGCVNGIQPLF
jgi:hypothetical protein